VFILDASSTKLPSLFPSLETLIGPTLMICLAQAYAIPAAQVRSYLIPISYYSWPGLSI
jgi:hypothetical protein